MVRDFNTRPAGRKSQRPYNLITLLFHAKFEREAFSGNSKDVKRVSLLLAWTLLIVLLQMTVFRVLFNHWKEFVTQRSKIPLGVNPRDHFAELLRRHRADAKSKKEASERRRLARMSAERRKKEKEEREKRRTEDLARLVESCCFSLSC